MDKNFKSAPVFAALGDLDELNATLGLVRAFAKKNLSQQILEIQNDLIEIGGFLAGMKKIDLEEKTLFLQEKIKKIAKTSVRTFSRPGANKTSAFLHLARAICRRLERRVVGLKKKNFQEVGFYLNLLSSYLFWL
ncbi:ATP:cob(I)alamin adenosyltransferase, partial [Patescibacteria group bacterium]|nr:ATP:cob(I)alamin adenosyltransferase [Patescibacteria group bacterium]